MSVDEAQTSSPKTSPGGLTAEGRLRTAPPAAGSIRLVSAGESGGHHTAATMHSPNVQESFNLWRVRANGYMFLSIGDNSEKHPLNSQECPNGVFSCS